MQSLIFPVLLLGLMWFFLIRPQRQKVAAHQAFLASLAVGDRVVTAGGIVGTIRTVGDDRVTLDVGGSTTIEFVRPAIHRRLEPQAEA